MKKRIYTHSHEKITVLSKTEASSRPSLKRESGSSQRMRKTVRDQDDNLIFYFSIVAVIIKLKNDGAFQMKCKGKKLSALYLLLLRVVFVVFTMILSSGCLETEAMKPFSGSHSDPRKMKDHSLTSSQSHFSASSKDEKLCRKLADEKRLAEGRKLIEGISRNYEKQKPRISSPMNHTVPSSSAPNIASSRSYNTKLLSTFHEEKDVPFSKVPSLPSSRRQVVSSSFVVNTASSVDSSQEMRNTAHTEKATLSSKLKKSSGPLLSHSLRTTSSFHGTSKEHNTEILKSNFQTDMHIPLNHLLRSRAKSVDQGSIGQGQSQMDSTFHTRNIQRNNYPEFSASVRCVRKETIKPTKSYSVLGKPRDDNRGGGARAKEPRARGVSMSSFSSTPLSDPMKQFHKKQPTQSTLLERLHSKSFYQHEPSMVQSTFLEKQQSKSSHQNQPPRFAQRTRSTLLERLHSTPSHQVQPTQSQFNKANTHKEADVKKRTAYEGSCNYSGRLKTRNGRFVEEDKEIRRIFKTTVPFQPSHNGPKRFRQEEAPSSFLKKKQYGDLPPVRKHAPQHQEKMPVGSDHQQEKGRGESREEGSCRKNVRISSGYSGGNDDGDDDENLSKRIKRIKIGGCNEDGGDKDEETLSTSPSGFSLHRRSSQSSIADSIETVSTIFSQSNGSNEAHDEWMMSDPEVVRKNKAPRKPRHVIYFRQTTGYSSANSYAVNQGQFFKKPQIGHAQGYQNHGPAADEKRNNLAVIEQEANLKMNIADNQYRDGDLDGNTFLIKKGTVIASYSNQHLLNPANPNLQIAPSMIIKTQDHEYSEIEGNQYKKDVARALDEDRKEEMSLRQSINPKAFTSRQDELKKVENYLQNNPTNLKVLKFSDQSRSKRGNPYDGFSLEELEKERKSLEEKKQDIDEEEYKRLNLLTELLEEAYEHKKFIRRYSGGF